MWPRTRSAPSSRSRTFYPSVYRLQPSPADRLYVTGAGHRQGKQLENLRTDIVRSTTAPKLPELKLD